jgi:hypothetical protein
VLLFAFSLEVGPSVGSFAAAERTEISEIGKAHLQLLGFFSLCSQIFYVEARLQL